MASINTKLTIVLDKYITEKAIEEMNNIMYKHLLTAREEMDQRFERLVDEMSKKLTLQIKQVLKEKVIIK